MCWHFWIDICIRRRYNSYTKSCHMCFAMIYVDIYFIYTLLHHVLCLLDIHMSRLECYVRMAPNTSSRWSRFWLVDATCTNTKMTNIINEWKIASFIPEISTVPEVLPPCSNDYENRIFGGGGFFFKFFL